MALLDVSDLLSDPNFSEALGVVSLIRSTQTVDAHGRVQFVPVTTPIVACVQPASPQTLSMLPVAIRVEGAIEIITATRLSALTDSTAPDVLLWNNRHYRVRYVELWTNFGAGHVVAVAELMELTAGASP